MSMGMSEGIIEYDDSKLLDASPMARSHCA